MVWQLSQELVIEIHKMSLNDLPKFEMYKEGSQIRRASKSVKSNIVEGYGRRKYINNYTRFLHFSIASNDEIIDHLEYLFETESLKDKQYLDGLHSKLTILRKKLNLFIQSIEKRKYNEN